MDHTADKLLVLSNGTGALCFKIFWMRTLLSAMALAVWETKCSAEKELGRRGGSDGQMKLTGTQEPLRKSYLI